MRNIDPYTIHFKTFSWLCKWTPGLAAKKNDNALYNFGLFDPPMGVLKTFELRRVRILNCLIAKNGKVEQRVGHSLCGPRHRYKS
jgi:hypothetical protein